MNTIDIRSAEAQSIAKSEGFAILDHDPEWTWFALDDGQTVAATEGQWPNIQTIGTKVIRTTFWMEAGRFEGIVSTDPGSVVRV